MSDKMVEASENYRNALRSLGPAVEQKTEKNILGKVSNNEKPPPSIE